MLILSVVVSAPRKVTANVRCQKSGCAGDPPATLLPCFPGLPARCGMCGQGMLLCNATPLSRRWAGISSPDSTTCMLVPDRLMSPMPSQTHTCRKRPTVAPYTYPVELQSPVKSPLVLSSFCPSLSRTTGRGDGLWRGQAILPCYLTCL